jgi:hypothetical protein
LNFVEQRLPVTPEIGLKCLQFKEDFNIKVELKSRRMFLKVLDGKSRIKNPGLEYRTKVMKLTRLQHTLALLFVFGLITCAYCATDECHWSIMGPTSVTFDWRGSDNVIYYGTVSGSLTSSMTASPANPMPTDSVGSYWECTLTGLSVNTPYYYKIGSDGIKHTFRTPPAAGSSGFTIVVTSDFQESSLPSTHTQNCMSQIAAVAPRFVLVTGDLTGADDYGASYVHTRFNDMMVWSQDAAYMPCFGNHDWDTAEQFNWTLGRVAFPNAQDTQGPYTNTPEDWCWFDYGNVRFISYPEGWDGGWENWNVKADAVFAAAQNDTNIKWIVVWGHRPAYSSGYHGNDGTKNMGPILNAYADKYSKFKLCFYGHNHLMEQSGPQGTHGVIYMCADSPYPCQNYSVTPKPSYVNFRALHPGFVKATFNSDNIVLQYVASDDDPRHFDVSEISGTHNPGDIVYTYTISDPADSSPPSPNPMTQPSKPTATVTTPVADTADQIHWTIISNTAVTFDWIGKADHISYGADPNNPNSTVYASHPAFLPVTSPWVSNPRPYWEARITGLMQDTLYYYKIGNSGATGHTFITPPPRGAAGPDGFDVCVTSDMHYDGIECQEVYDMIADIKPKIVLTCGDTSGVDSGSTVDARFQMAMVWSQDSAWMPAWGNHDWEYTTVDDLRSYKGRFDLPNAQTSPGSPAVSCCGEDWDWFDYGNTRFISYPEPWTDDSLADWNTKAKAIMDASQADRNIKFIVTYGHRPAYTSGHHESEMTLRGYLDALGDNHNKYVLNFNGHSHNYERTFPQHGVTHITDMSGGGGFWKETPDCYYPLYRGVCAPPPFSAARYSHYGILKLHFSDNAVQGAFYCGPGTALNGTDPPDVNCVQGSVLDSFTIAAPVQDTNGPSSRTQ